MTQQTDRPGERGRTRAYSRTDGLIQRLNRPWVAVLAGVVLLMLLVAAGVTYGSYHRRIHLPEPLQSKIDLLPDVNAKEGTVIATEADGEVAAGNFRIVLNQPLLATSTSTTCRIGSENPEENPYDLRICLYLEETGELLGASHLVRRGMRLEEMELDRTLDAGEYPVVAKLELYDEDKQSAGELAMELTLRVKD